MLFISDVIPQLRAQLFLASLCRSNPVIYDHKKGKFVAWVKDNQFLKYSKTIASILVIISTVRLILRITHYAESSLANLTSIVFCWATVIAWFMALDAHRRSDDIADFFNGLLQLERLWKGQKDSPTTGPRFSKLNWKNAYAFNKAWIMQDAKDRDVCRFTLSSAIFVNVFIPFGIFAFLLSSPCSMAIFLRSAVEDCPTNNELLSLPVTAKYIVTLLDVYAIYWSFSQGIFQIGFVFFLGAKCIKDLLVVVSNEEQNLEECIKKFRHVQILLRHYNNINRETNLPVLMLDVFSLSVMSFFIIIAFYDRISLAMVVIFTMLGVSSAVYTQIGMYMTAAAVNTWSNEIKYKLRKNMQLDRVVKGKRLNRMIKSCPSLKIDVGKSGNFIERTTPLVISQMTVDQTASLLLLNRQN